MLPPPQVKVNEAMWARLQRAEAAISGATTDAEDAVVQLQAALQQGARLREDLRRAQAEHELQVRGECNEGAGYGHFAVLTAVEPGPAHSTPSGFGAAAGIKASAAGLDGRLHQGARGHARAG